jgi:hypothetical protein
VESEEVCAERFEKLLVLDSEELENRALFFGLDEAILSLSIRCASEVSDDMGVGLWEFASAKSWKIPLRKSELKVDWSRTLSERLHFLFLRWIP